jgi:hypothetical protein
MPHGEWETLPRRREPEPFPWRAETNVMAERIGLQVRRQVN